MSGGTVAWIGAGLLALASGCGDKQVSDSGNPFGTTSGTGSTAPATGADSGEAGSMGSGSASETSEPTTGSPTAEGSTSNASMTNGSTTEISGDSTTGPAGMGQLGECVGIGAWASCAQYCEAILEQCVPGGCGGMTVVYYGDVAACQAMEADGGEASACADPFAGGGGISFARCCCT